MSAARVPHWVAAFVGRPFVDHGRGPEGFDCWGLVREVYRVRAGVDLPDYGEVYADAADARAIAAEITTQAAAWHEVPAEWADELDVVVLRVAGRPVHVGLVTCPGWFVHALEGVGVSLERLGSPLWRPRVVGVFRHG